MANRHLSRSIVLQTLFEWDFNGQKDTEIQDKLKRNTEEFAPGLEDWDFISGLTDLVLKKRKIIDEIIEKAAPEWPIDKIGIVDRNVLRIGLTELLFGDREQVPPKVAINEAIELAKTYGGENSGRFTNGVLGAVYKEIGEPGKEQVSKKKNESIDPATLPVQKLAGAVVYIKKNDPAAAKGSGGRSKFYLGLVHDIFGYWTLSKGKIEEGEDLISGAKRELKEEINLDIEIKDKLGENEYIVSHPEKGRFRKNVTYFLAEAKNYDDLKLAPSTGLDDARWFDLSEIADLKIYNDIIPLITKAIEIISLEK